MSAAWGTARSVERESRETIRVGGTRPTPPSGWFRREGAGCQHRRRGMAPAGACVRTGGTDGKPGAAPERRGEGARAAGPSAARCGFRTERSGLPLACCTKRTRSPRTARRCRRGGAAGNAIRGRRQGVSGCAPGTPRSAAAEPGDNPESPTGAPRGARFSWPRGAGRSEWRQQSTA
jgi:hypothetical protein